MLLKDEDAKRVQRQHEQRKSNRKVHRCEILLILMSCIMFDDTNHLPAVFWRECFLQGFHCEQRVQKLENCSFSSADIEIQLTL